MSSTGIKPDNYDNLEANIIDVNDSFTSLCFKLWRTNHVTGRLGCVPFTLIGSLIGIGRVVRDQRLGFMYWPAALARESDSKGASPNTRQLARRRILYQNDGRIGPPSLPRLQQRPPRIGGTPGAGTTQADTPPEQQRPKKTSTGARDGWRQQRVMETLSSTHWYAESGFCGLIEVNLCMRLEKLLTH